MMRVVAVGDRAWTLPLLRERGRVEDGDLVLSWSPGQASALDADRIADGWDVGNVVVQRQTENGFEDVPYDLTFAFVVHAFVDGATVHTLDGPVRLGS